MSADLTDSVAFIDHVDTVAAEERGGALRSLTRLFRVVNVYQPTDADPFTAYQNLKIALETAGVPTIPDTVTGDGFEPLMLDERSVKIVEGDPSCFDVTCTYRHVLEGTQELPDPRAIIPGVLYTKSRCSIQQFPVNFYLDYSQDPPVQKPITVEHTFPDGTNEYLDENGVIRPADKDYSGETITQGGEIQATVPMRSLILEGYIDTDFPSQYESAIIAKLNKGEWRGQPDRTWLCSEVQWEVVKENRYKYHYEFQNNPFGWDTYAVFIDQRYGRPPPALIENKGYKLIKYLDDVDYDDFFEAVFDF